jgi:hypothetical protein
MPGLFGYRAIVRMEADPWTPPPSLVLALLANPRTAPAPKDQEDGEDT